MNLKLLIPSIAFVLSSIAMAEQVGQGIYKQHMEDPKECPMKEITKAQYWNGLVLSEIVAAKVEVLRALERAKGNELKIVLLARAGQNLSGVMTLKDVDAKGNVLTVEDLFKKIDFGWYKHNSNGNEVNGVQMDLKKEFGDKARQLIYSHMGMLVVNHPIANMGLKFSGMDMTGDLWVEELLKPCISMAPRAWATGIEMFFMDDPHDYRALIMIPPQATQDRLYDILINHKEEYKKYLTKTYNAAARYNNTEEQNSNQYVLEMVVAAQSPDYLKLMNRSQTFDYLKQTGFRPTKIIANSFKAGFMTSVFAPKSMNIRDEDNKYARPYVVAEFVTELSVREYFLRMQILKAETIHEVILPPAYRVIEVDSNNKPKFHN